LFLIAGLVGVAGYFLQQSDNRTQAKLALTLSEAPPEVVNIEDYNRSEHRNTVREVLIRAQLEMSMKYELTQEERGADELGFMVGPLATDARESEIIEAAPGIVLLTGRDF
jgi:hypothetical protein